MLQKLQWYIIGVMGLTVPFSAYAQTGIAAEGPNPKFIIKPYGDLRLRSEIDRTVVNDRFRERIRFRTGMNVASADNLKLEFRLVTTVNTDDPNSTHADFRSGFNQIPVALDRAYLRWSPRTLKPMQVSAGKFPFPFENSSVYPELIWDADIQADGINASFSWSDAAIFRKINLHAGGYLPSAFVSGRSASWLGAGQLSASAALAPKFELVCAAGYYHYVNVKGSAPSGGSFDDNTANLIAPDNSYASDFYILHPFLLLKAKNKKPLTLKGEYFSNPGAGDNNTGFVIGVSLGSVENKGNWRVFYQFQALEQDAVFSPVAQDDFLASSGFRGHTGGVEIALSDNVSLNNWCLLSAPFLGSAFYSQRYRIDLNVKF